MSGNNSYIKSMNGIVSFDSNGTTIDGDTITSGEIDCITLNAKDVKATGSLNTSYIYVDYMDKNINAYITFISDVLFDYKLYASNLWPSTGTNIIINGFLNIINGLKTPTIEGIDTNSLTKQLKIGQDNDYTTSINIGRKEITILGTVYPAIPPRTTFYAVGDDDIVNKKYVDTVTGGSSILNSTNIWTGTSNTFNNVIYTSQIDSVTPSITYNLLTNNTAGINIGTSSSVITLGSSVSPVRCPYVPLITTDICNKLYVDTVSSSAGSSLLSLTNTWTGTSNTFNNTVNLGSFKFSGTNIEGIVNGGQTYTFLNNITISNLRIGHAMTTGNLEIANNKTSGEINIMNQVPTSANINIGDNSNGAINLVRNSTTTGYVNIANTFKIFRNNFEYYTSINPLFNFCNNLLSTNTMQMGGAGTVKLCNSINVSPNTIASVGVGDTINLFNNITTGILNICNSGLVNVGNNGGSVYLGNNNGTVNLTNNFSFNNNSFDFNGSTSIVNLFSSVLLYTVNFCNNLTTGILNIGGAGKINIGTSKISGYSTFGTSTVNFSIPSTINVSNYLFVATGTNTSQVLTLPSYIDTQIIYIRNNKISTSLVVQCFGTESLRLKNNGTATNITVGANTTTILIGTTTTWYYFL